MRITILRRGADLILSGLVMFQGIGAVCVAPPSGLVGWWQGEDNTSDVAGQAPGMLSGGATYTPGLVGQAFSLNGTTAAVSLGNNPAFQLQSFTIEAWIKRESSERPSQVSPYFGAILGGGANHFALAMYPNGLLTLGKVGVSNADSARGIVDTQWHHLVATKSGPAVAFYIDGEPAGTTSQPSVFSFETPLAIGALGEAFPGVGTEPFWGAIDEPSLYDRALTEAEVKALFQSGSAGKCFSNPPVNLVQNGSFEEPAYPQVQGPAVRTQTLPGWEVAPSAGAIDVELASFGGAAAAEGAQSVDLEGAEGLAAYFIRQSVTVVPGRNYRLRFAYAKNPARELSRMRVEATGSSLTAREFEHATANTRENPGWVWEALEFTANSTPVTVQFTGLSPNPGYGMLLDEVGLFEVGEIPVANPGFEALTGADPAHFDEQGRLRDGHFSSYPGFPVGTGGFHLADAIPGWSGNTSGGTFNPSSALFPAGVAEGQNTAWINVSGQIGQVLGTSFQAERRYRLSVDVGAAAGVAFPGYVVGLYANGQAVAEDRNTLTIPAGEFRRVSVEAVVPLQSAWVGAPIEVRLGIPGSQAEQVNFDNVRLTIESPEPPADCVTPSAALAAWYRGEGTAEDWLGNFPGTFTQARYGPGKIGQAFDFNGSSEVVIPDAPVFNRDAFTLEAWIFPTALDGAVDIILNKEAGPDISLFQFELGLKGPVNDVTGTVPLGNLAFYLGGVTGLPDDYGGWTDGLANVPLNLWTHVALAVEPGTVSVHVNGVETRRITGLGGAVRTTSGPLKIGSRHEWFVNQRPGERFNGRIDEFGFHTRRLSSGEIAAIHRGGGTGRCSEDLELQVDGPARVALNEDFLITARLMNFGTAPATAVTLTNVIPVGISVLAITNSQGQTMNLAGVAISDLGVIPGRQEATVHFLCRALLAGPYQISASAGRGEIDLIEENNRQTFAFEAAPLTLTLGPDVSVGEATHPAAELTVSLSAPVGRTVTVDYYTVEGTAKAGRDFTAVSGTLTFAPGSAEVILPVPLANDAFFEADETFTVALTNAVGAPLTRSNAVVTIISDDARPLLRIGDAIVREGNGGPTNAMLLVKLTGASEEPVTVAFATLNGSALSPTDYLATNGVLTFAPGVAEQTFAVRVNGDTVVEPNETVFLNLTDATNADIADIVGTVAIVNDDFIPGQVVSFAWEPVTSPQELGKPFAAQFSARDGGGNVVTDFNGAVQLAATGNGRRPASVVISEVDTGGADRVEFTNVQADEVDVSGWSVVLYDGASWPLPAGVTLVPANAKLPTRGTFLVSEGPLSSSFPSLRTGFPVNWGTDAPEFRPIAVLLLDAGGRLVDFFCAAGADPAQLAVPMSIPAPEWTGLPLRSQTSGTYQRAGNEDRNCSADWNLVTFGNVGQPNQAMTTPFADSQHLSVTPEVALDFTGGIWSGNLQVNGFAPQVSLSADDGNGHTGFSLPFALTTVDDLAVTLTLSQPLGLEARHGLHPLQEIRHRATVTNPGPEIATNVVLEVRLAPYYGRTPSPMFIRQVQASQGTTQLGTYSPPGGNFPPPAVRVTANLGEISPGGMATLEFTATFQQIGPAPTLPANVVSTAIVTRAQPEANLANNTATAEIEASASCAPLRPTAVAWWRGEDDLLDALGGHPLLREGEGEVFAPGRVGPQGLNLSEGVRLSAADASALNFAAGDSLTLEGWVRLPPYVCGEAAPGWLPDDVFVLMDKRDEATGTGYALLVEQGRLQLRLKDQFGGTVAVAAPLPNQAPDLRDGRWHHVAATVTLEPGLPVTLRVDGFSVPFRDLGDLGDLTTPAPLRLGHAVEGGPERAWPGELDEWAVYRAALTGNELAAIFQAGAAGKCLAQLAVQVVEPAFTGSFFDEPISLGRPVTVSLLFTNAGPLAVPATWLQTFLVNDAGDARPAVAVTGTNVLNPWTTHYNLGPLAAGESRLLPVAVTLTNLSANPPADFSAFVPLLDLRLRGQGASLRFRVNRDGDGDGLDDDWELANGLNPADPADALLDADDDGVNNLEEFRTGTNIRDAADRLRLELTARSDTSVTLRVATKVGRGYRLLRAVGSPAAEWTALTDNLGGTGEVLEFTDPNPPAGDVFYRLLVE